MSPIMLTATKVDPALSAHSPTLNGRDQDGKTVQAAELGRAPDRHQRKLP
jgi:hypothetical protein